jgi:hypothetical protein
MTTCKGQSWRGHPSPLVLTMIQDNHNLPMLTYINNIIIAGTSIENI